MDVLESSVDVEFNEKSSQKMHARSIGQRLMSNMPYMYKKKKIKRFCSAQYVK